MNSYSLSAKNEITGLSFSTDCCKRAFLSALVHTGGSLVISRGGMKIELYGLSRALKEKLTELVGELADGVSVGFEGADTFLFGEGLGSTLYGLGIFVRAENGETAVSRGILPPLISQDCCAVNFIRGAFLGAGSVSLRAGYHLEFVLSGKELACDLKALLERFGITVKITQRKDKYVAYIKESEAVSDCLALMGASEAVLELNSQLIIRQFRQETNRRTNCEMANLSKTVNASVRQIEDIKYISRKAGLASLPDKLLIVAEARLEFPDESFAFLADRLNISKSTLKNRLLKIGVIAGELREERKEK